MEKNSFILYQEYEQHFELLSDEESGKLIKAIFEYTKTGNVPKLPPLPHMAFISIKSALDRDKQKYVEEIKKRSDAGKKGMAKRWKDKEKNNSVITNDNKNNSVKSVNNNAITNDNKNNSVKSVNNKKYQTITKITDNENVSENDNENVNVNDSDNVNENENVKTHACVVNLSHEKFLQTFKNKKIDGELLPGQNMDELINAINRSQFLKSSNNLGLKWFAEHYDEVLADNYKDFTAKQKTKKQDNDLQKAMERLGVNENE